MSDDYLKEPPPLIRPFGDRFVLFGLPPGDYAGVVRGEDLADLERQLAAAEDSDFLADLGIKG